MITTITAAIITNKNINISNTIKNNHNSDDKNNDNNNTATTQQRKQD